MKVLLISLPVKKGDLDYPLAMIRLNQSLHKIQDKCPQLKVEILILNPKESLDEMQKNIMVKSCNLLCFSSYIWNRDIYKELVPSIKRDSSEMKILMGGPDVTANPEFYIRECQSDYTISGEGEIAFPLFIDELLNEGNFEDFNWLGTQEKPLPQERAPVPQLKELPSPFTFNPPLPGKFNTILWELTRGCPYNCSFCFEAKGAKGLRSLRYEQFKMEAQWLVEQELDEVFVLDPSFNFTNQRCIEILQYLVELEPQCRFHFEIRMERLELSQVELFSQLNCSLQIGLQSADPDICRSLNRKLDPDDFAMRAQWLVDHQIPFGIDLIYGLPGDSLSGYRESLNYALNLCPSNLELFPLMLLEGTEMWEKREQFGIKEGGDDFQGWIHPSFSSMDMREARSLSETACFFYSWSMAADWLKLLADNLYMKPINIIEEYQQWALKRENKSPGDFLDIFLKDGRGPLLREYVRLYQAISQLQDNPEAAITVELRISPDELERLPDWEDCHWQNQQLSQCRSWCLYLSLDGIEWELLE